MTLGLCVSNSHLLHFWFPPFARSNPWILLSTIRELRELHRIRYLRNGVHPRIRRLCDMVGIWIEDPGQRASFVVVANPYASASTAQLRSESMYANSPRPVHRSQGFLHTVYYGISMMIAAPRIGSSFGDIFLQCLPHFVTYFRRTYNTVSLSLCVINIGRPNKEWSRFQLKSVSTGNQSVNSMDEN
jgi:hypothetical protein